MSIMDGVKSFGKTAGLVALGAAISGVITVYSDYRNERRFASSKPLDEVRSGGLELKIPAADSLKLRTIDRDGNGRFEHYIEPRGGGRGCMLLYDPKADQITCVPYRVEAGRAHVIKVE